jgi:hypothetical protein
MSFEVSDQPPPKAAIAVTRSHQTCVEAETICEVIEED